jgi:uncharacterized membrane protein
MSAYKVLLILAAVSFFIGALAPTFRLGGPPNWTDLGLGFATVAWIVSTRP